MSKKVTDLAALTRADAADLLLVSDVAPTPTSKSITSAELGLSLLFAQSAAGITEHEDFLANAGVLQTLWASSVTGAAAAVGSATWVANHPGAAALSTGTTTTGRASIYRDGTSPVLLGSDALDLEWILRVPTLATAGEDFIVTLGMGDILTGEPTNGFFFGYERTVSANWLACSSRASSFTRTSTGIAVGTGWVRLGMRINAAGTSVDFYVNGTLATTLSGTLGAGNFPASTACYGPIAVILKSAGTTSRSMEIDYVGQRWTLGASR